MRRNRRVTKKMSVIATNTLRFGAIVIFFFVMVILNLLASSSCTQLMKEKGLRMQELAKLEESRQRESTRWEEMKTPEKIEVALLRHGLMMKLPRADQSVRMDAKGVPRLGQLSVTRAKQRGAGLERAQFQEEKVIVPSGRYQTPRRIKGKAKR